MKILLFSDQYYPLGGGIEQYLRGLGRELTRQGYKNTILTRTIEGSSKWEEMPEGLVIRTPLLLDAIPHPEKVLKRWRALLPIIKDISPDIVYANHHASLAAIKACKELRIPIVYGCHGWGLLCPLKIRFLRPDNSLCWNERRRDNCVQCFRILGNQRVIDSVMDVLRSIKRRYAILKTIPDLVAKYDMFQRLIEDAEARIVLAKAWKGFLKIKDTFIIPLGLDIDVFKKAADSVIDEFRKKYGLQGKYILITSRIHNIKGHEWAIRAMQFLPNDLKLVIAGNSSLFSGSKFEDNIHTQKAISLIEKIGIKDRVIFTGFLDTEEMIQAYSGASATVVPSIWLEPFGYVTAEAMACECPVIVTENCGTAEIITNGVEGYVIPRMNSEAIAEAVLNIIPKRVEMGKMARRTVVKTLNWNHIAVQILEVLEKVVATYNRPTAVL